MTPHDVLGILPDASEYDARRAYRALARKYHPDRNPGDQDAEARFKEASAAYDAVRNKHSKEDDNRGEAVEILSRTFVQVLGGIIQRGGNPAECDLSALIRTPIEDAIKKAENAIASLVKAEKTLRGVRGRFHAKKKKKDSRAGDDASAAEIFEAILARELAQIAHEQAKHQDVVKFHKASLEIMRDVTFKHDPKSGSVSTVAAKVYLQM